jgi:DNA-binding CsgD family transcriptional regulator
MARKRTGRPAGRPAHPGILTPAEERVLAGVRDGLTNGEIAVRLGISLDGVKFHVSNMLGKLQLESRDELARWKAPREGVLRRAWGGVPLLAKLVAGAGGVAVVGVVVAAILAGDGRAKPAAPPVGPLEDGLVSVALDGTGGNGYSLRMAISGDGRFVAFESNASNLVQGDSNGVMDVFVRDRMLGTTVRVSVTTAGNEANAISRAPAISRDGRYVAFESMASNLVQGVAIPDDEALAQLSPEERAPYTTTVPGRAPAIPSVSPALHSNIYRHDMQSGKTEIVSVALDGRAGLLGSGAPALSADGRYVAFDSIAPNLVTGDTNTGKGGLMGDIALLQGGGCDVFVRDMDAGRTVRVSVATDGAEGIGSSSSPSISADGQVVAFLTDAGNLAPGIQAAKMASVRDLKSGKTQGLAGPPVGPLWIGRPAVSDDGNTIVTAFGTFQPPAAGAASSGSLVDLEVLDRRTGKNRQLSAPPLYLQAPRVTGPVLSGDGKLIADWQDIPIGDLRFVTLDGKPVGVTAPALLPNPAGRSTDLSYPALNTDGSQFAFVSPDAEFAQVYAQHR